MDADEIQAQIDALEIEHAEAMAAGDQDELVADIASELGALRELLEEGDEPEVADEEEVAEEEAIEEIEEVAPIEVPPEEEEETEEVEEEMEEELVRDETALSSQMVEIIEQWNTTVTGDKTGDVGTRREIINELFGTSIMEELVKIDPTFSNVELEIPEEDGVPYDIIRTYDDADRRPLYIELASSDDEIAARGLGKVMNSITGTHFAAGDMDYSEVERNVLRYLRPRVTAFRRQQHMDIHFSYLTRIRGAMKHLNEVFGFDDRRHLEAFISAWLMQDSTCRLSGIPGTGKTTVIESAAVLLCNSYGFSSRPRFLARLESDKIEGPGGVKRDILIYRRDAPDEMYSDEETRIARHEFPTGQLYNVLYSDVERGRGVKDAWEVWRFNEWEADSMVSGSYLYDYRYLRRHRSHRVLVESGDTLVVRKDTSSTYTKTPMSPDRFYEILFNYALPKQLIYKDAETGMYRHPKLSLQPTSPKDAPLMEHLPISVAKRNELVPYLMEPLGIKLSNFHWTGSKLLADVSVDVPPGYAMSHQVDYAFFLGDPYAPSLQRKLAELTMESAEPAFLEDEDIPSETLVMDVFKSVPARPELIQTVVNFGLVDMSKIENEGYEVVIHTDTGLNEGFVLREFLLTAFYDERTGPSKETVNIKSIDREMRQEVGIAKIDADKRADEILYGIDIQQITEEGVKGSVQTYKFTPVPRSIVTQPVKFFNEANRSGAGVEDAVLGLIAEREVEYRGQTFDSPNFVAWMDTNPHQKPNDLAFTDRIDMELYFGSIGMGANQVILENSYGSGESGGSPKEKLIENICSGYIDRPLRFHDLRTVWQFIGGKPGSTDMTGLQFTPPNVNTGYNGLRDISVVSVLFTQAWQSRIEAGQAANISGEGFVLDSQQPFMRHRLSESDSPYFSPLADISRATYDTVINAGENTPVRNWDYGSQPPGQFKRVLGFRFSNSLVKMSRALAFLRGKEYVTRQEIIDALPFVTGHRMGRARAENREAFGVTATSFASEQEFIKEAVVHGFLLRNTVSSFGTESPQGIQTFFESLDSFYARCKNVLTSCQTYVQYENIILKPLQAQIGIGSPSYSPIHWHLAVSVVEAERAGYTNFRQQQYEQSMNALQAPEDMKADYPRMVGLYTDRTGYPDKRGMSSASAMGEDFAIYDYYNLRGLVANEPYLFTDDRATLLSLVDSQIDIIARGPTKASGVEDITANPIGVSVGFPFDEGGGTNLAWSGYGPSPLTMAWRTYGDTLGAYGLVVSGGTPALSTLLATEGESTFDFAGLGADSSATSTALASQEKMVIANIETFNPKKTEREEVSGLKEFTDTLTRFNTNFSKYADGDGIILRATEDTDGNTFLSPLDEGGQQLKTSSGSASLSGYIQYCIELMNTLLTSKKKDEVNNAFNVLDYEDGRGLMACFPLQHAPASGISGGLQRMAGGMGNLRLWLRFGVIAESAEGLHKPGENIPFTLLVGITSDSAILQPENGKLKYLELTDRRAYTHAAYSNPDESFGNVVFVDSGNMTKEDAIFYLTEFSNSLSASLV